MSTWEQRALDWTDHAIDTFRSALKYKTSRRTDDELRSILTYVSKEQGVDLIIKEMHHQITVQLEIIKRQRDVIDAANVRHNNLMELLAKLGGSEKLHKTGEKIKKKEKPAPKEKVSNVIAFKKK